MIDCVQLAPTDLRGDQGLRAELERLAEHVVDLLPGAPEAPDHYLAYASGVYVDHLTECLLSIEVLTPEWAAHDEYINSLDQAA